MIAIIRTSVSLLFPFSFCCLSAGAQVLPDFVEIPTPGKRALVAAPEYIDTDVRHVVYLPPNWMPDKKWPVIVEYTGNYAPTLGSTGEIEDAGLGFGVSGGECIWVVLPYVSESRKHHEVKWWGDVDATVEYAKKNVPRICEQFSGDADAVVVCGFSRGAIGTNFIGLHDDDIAKLWCGFLTHDHYDGVREWGGTDWGTPLKKYRNEAAERLRRIGDRPVLVSQNGSAAKTREYLEEVIPVENFTFLDVPVPAIFGDFPNEIAIHPHTDRWLLKESPARNTVREWFTAAVGRL